MFRRGRFLSQAILAVMTLGVAAFLMAGCASASPSASTQAAAASQGKTLMVMIPGKDYYSPAVLTIHAGDTVQWMNMDTDGHTITAAPASSGTSVPDALDMPIAGTDANHGQPGLVSHTFLTSGTLIYYCRLHAYIDASTHQIAARSMASVYPVPMMGVITILP